MKVLVALSLLWFLTACTSIDYARHTAAAGYDAALDGSEAMLCNDGSIGSIRRKYCATKEGCERWVNFCFPQGIGNAITPSN